MLVVGLRTRTELESERRMKTRADQPLFSSQSSKLNLLHILLSRTSFYQFSSTMTGKRVIKGKGRNRIQLRTRTYEAFSRLDVS